MFRMTNDENLIFEIPVFASKKQKINNFIEFGFLVHDTMFYKYSLLRLT